MSLLKCVFVGTIAWWKGSAERSDRKGQINDFNNCSLIFVG